MSRPANSSNAAAMPGLSRILFILGCAALGGVLITLPSLVVDVIDQARQLGPVGYGVFLALTTAGLLLLIAAAGWFAFLVWRNSRRRRRRRARQQRSPSQMAQQEIEDEIEEHTQQLRDIAADEHIPENLQAEIQQLSDRLTHKREQQTLELVAFGTISSGKSSLLNALAGREMFRTAASGGTTTVRGEVEWQGTAKAILVDTPGIGEANDVDHAAIARQAARDADLVLFVVEGPLRDSEHQTLSLLGEMEKRILVCLNKSDWYAPADREELLNQVREQVAPIVRGEDVVWVQSRPVERQRVRVKPDGQEVAEVKRLPPDITPLAERMLQTIRREGQSLLMANLLLRSRAVVYEARERVKTALDQEAQRLVDRYTWGGAGLAAVMPGMGLDLTVAVGVAVKMVADLAKLYRQPIEDWATLRHMIESLPKKLLAVIGANGLTPLASSLAASGLKMIPGVGTVAGGVLQGLTQAIVIQWYGKVFITYFRQEMTEPPGGLAMLARQKWDEVTRPANLRALIRTGLRRLRDAGVDEAAQPADELDEAEAQPSRGHRDAQPATRPRAQASNVHADEEVRA